MDTVTQIIYQSAPIQLTVIWIELSYALLIFFLFSYMAFYTYRLKLVDSFEKRLRDLLNIEVAMKIPTQWIMIHKFWVSLNSYLPESLDEECPKCKKKDKLYDWDIQGFYGKFCWDWKCGYVTYKKHKNEMIGVLEGMNKKFFDHLNKSDSKDKQSEVPLEDQENWQEKLKRRNQDRDTEN